MKSNNINDVTFTIPLPKTKLNLYKLPITEWEGKWCRSPIGKKQTMSTSTNLSKWYIFAVQGFEKHNCNVCYPMLI